MSWYSDATPEQRRTLAAAGLGWMLDAMDVLLYAFALTSIRAEFGLSSAAAGALAAVPLVTSAVGGTLFGWLSDRFGRARALMGSILAFSIFTALAATSRNALELGLWRGLVGVGLGGEWTAGSVLVAETWPADRRARAIGLMQSGWAIGYMLAAALAALVLPAWGWRPLFLLGILPALFTLWIRRRVPEPAAWRERDRSAADFGALLRPPLARLVLLASSLCSLVLFAYWGLFTWIPAYLATPVERGGAGMGLVRSSAWIVPMQAGAFFGYVSFGYLADRVGRRPAFIGFVLAAAALVPVYGLAGSSPALLMALGPLVGFFGHGYFSVFGVMLAELFPSAVRAAAQGFCYNVGRALSALAPITVGALADRHGVGAALGLTSVFFALGGALMLLLPETRGEKLT